MGFDFEIQYKSRLENKAVDALSRINHGPELQALSVPLVLNFEVLSSQALQDEKLRKICETLQVNSKAVAGYSLQQGRLFYKGRLVIPKKSPFIPLLLQEFHCSKIGGHLGVLKTYKRLSSELFRDDMSEDVADFVSACIVCQ